MSLPEMLSRAEDHAKLLYQAVEKLDAIMTLVYGERSDSSREIFGTPTDPPPVSWSYEMLRAQEMCGAKITELLNRLDDFRGLLGWSEEVAIAKKWAGGIKGLEPDNRPGANVGRGPRHAQTNPVGYPGIDDYKHRQDSSNAVAEYLAGQRQRASDSDANR